MGMRSYTYNYLKILINMYPIKEKLKRFGSKVCNVYYIKILKCIFVGNS